MVDQPHVKGGVGKGVGKGVGERKKGRGTKLDKSMEIEHVD